MANLTDAQAKKFASLIKKHAVEEDDLPKRDPIDQLVVAFLQWNATAAQADAAHERIMSQMVDANEVRVAYLHELLELVGEDYPQVHERLTRMDGAMQEIYIREYHWRPESIKDQAKKDQRAYLDSLPGTPSYIPASIMLLCFGAHALPVDDKLCEMLKAEKVLPEDATPAEAEPNLLRTLKAGEARGAHLAMQAWADATEWSTEPMPQAPPAKPPVAVTPAKKKTIRKKVTGKTTQAAKSTKKKPARVAKKK